MNMSMSLSIGPLVALIAGVLILAVLPNKDAGLGKTARTGSLRLGRIQ